MRTRAGGGEPLLTTPIIASHPTCLLPHHALPCGPVRRRLEGLKWDLRAWRAEEEGRKGGPKQDLAEGFELLDLDNGAGWQLLCDLMAYKPSDRCVPPLL